MVKQAIIDFVSFSVFIFGVYGMILFWDYLSRIV